MNVTVHSGGKDYKLDVPEGGTIAAAAALEGIDMYGSCQGKGICGRCSRRVIEGMAKLFNVRREQQYDESAAPFVQTCKTTPTEPGSVIDADEAYWK